MIEKPKDGFEPKKFLYWLDEQDGAIRADTMDEVWPNFPWDRMKGVTGPIDENGEFMYYKRDLRRAAQGFRNLD